MFIVTHVFLIVLSVPHSGCPQTAFEIIQDHPQVISDRVGILGLSFGTMVTLMVATSSKVVKVSIPSTFWIVGRVQENIRSHGAKQE